MPGIITDLRAVPGAMPKPAINPPRHLPNNAFLQLSEAAREMLDIPRDLAAALGFTLHVIESRLSQSELDQLIRNDLPDIAQVLAANEDHAPLILDSLTKALSLRRPSESVRDVMQRAVSTSALRDLQRSVSRAEAGDLAHTLPADQWRAQVTQWLRLLHEAAVRFRWAGSGHDPKARHGHPSESAFPAAQPLASAPRPPNFRDAGVMGFVLWWLYATQTTTAPGSRAAFETTRSAHLVDAASPFAEPSGEGTLTRLADAVLAYRSGQHAPGAQDQASDVIPFRDNVAHVNDLRARRSAEQASVSSTATPAGQFVEASSTPAVVPAPRPEIDGIASSATFHEEVATFIGLLRNRTMEHKAAFRLTQSTVNLTQIIETSFTRRLTRAALPDKSAPTLDNVFLYQFDTFDFPDAPQSYDIRHLQRSALRSRTPIVDAAMRIVSGQQQLRIENYGVYAGDLKEHRKHPASEQVPGLSIDTFLGALTEWKWLGQQGASSIEAQRFLKKLDASQRHMARDDLQLSYAAGHLSADAVVLGQIVLDTPVYASQGPLEYVRTYTVHLTGSGVPDTMPIAAMFATTEHEDDGRALLYLAGDAHPWREYANLSALQADLASATSGLTGAVRARLPLRVTSSARSTPPDTQHAPRNDTGFRLKPSAADPLVVARAASLTVVLDDIAFDVTRATAPARAGDYAAWFAGATPHARYQSLQSGTSLGTSLPPGARPAARVIALPEDIESSIESLLDLRAQVSMLLPDERRIARAAARDALKALDAEALDPDLIRLEICTQTSSPPGTSSGNATTITSMSLTNAVLEAVSGRPPVPLAGQVMRLARVARSPNAPAGQAASTPPLPDANAFMRRVPFDHFQENYRNALEDFIAARHGSLRQVLRASFGIDALSLALQQKLDPAQVALAQAVAEDSQRGDNRIPIGVAPPTRYSREWISLGGVPTRLMLFTDAQTHKVLMYAPGTGNGEVTGFDSRAAMQTWLTEQARSPDGRRRLLSLLQPHRKREANAKLEAFAAEASTTDTLPDTVGAPVDGDTFQVVADRMLNHSSAYLNATLTTGNSGESVVGVARAIRWIDMTMGLGTWAADIVRPASISASISDGMIGALLAAFGDEHTRPEGWKSLATAIGSQGISALRLQILSRLPGGAKYHFFVDGPLDGVSGVIDGLYYVDGEFIAHVDEFTYAHLTFDFGAGEFRLWHPETNELGPHMRLDATGGWRVIPQSEVGASSSLNEPHLAYEIDQAYGARLEAVRNEATLAERKVFRNAKNEAYLRGTRPIGERAPATYHMLLFIAPEISDYATLGEIAGEVENALAAEASSELVSDIETEAAAGGAVVTRVTDIPGVPAGTLDNGMVRAMAVAVRDGEEGTLLAHQSEFAMAPEAPATQQYVDQMQSLGASEYAGNAIHSGADSVRTFSIDNLGAALDGKANIERIYEMTTPHHIMLFGRRVIRMRTEYFFFDPATGIVVHPDKAVVLETTIRHLKRMSATYGAFRFPGGPAVMMRRVDVGQLTHAPIAEGRSVQDLFRLTQ